MDIVFVCRKCGHLLFVSKPTIEKLECISNRDCDNCGEEGYENWILSRTGDYEKEYGQK